MKKILLLSFISVMAFSCTEYSDDGLPPEGDLALYNPDGSKKLKRVTNDIVTTINMSSVDTPTNQPITIVTQSNGETTYNRSDYNFETVVTSTTTLNGLEDLLGQNLASLDTDNVLTTTSRMDGFRLDELRTQQVFADSTITKRTVYTYDDELIARIVNFDENQSSSQATFTFNADNVVMERTYTDDSYGNETYNFSVVDSLITSISIENSLTDNTIDIVLSRDSVNLTQATISRGSESLSSTYSYDTSHYYLHTLGGTTHLKERMVAELIALSQIPSATQINQEPLLVNIESGIKKLTDLATNNLTNRSIGGTVIERNSYTYDEEDYPIAVISDVDSDSTVIISALFAQIENSLLQNLLDNGLTEDEALAEIDETMAMLYDMETFTEGSSTSTIEYFE